MSAAAKSRTARNLRDVHDLHDLIVVPRRDLSLDLANTVAWRGSAPADSLRGFHDVLAWLASSKAIPARGVAEIRGWFEARPADAAIVFRDTIEIRETLYRLLHCAASKTAPASEDLRRLNNALREAPPRANLDRAEKFFGWRIELKPVAAGILAPILWSAADIMAGPDCARVRQCTNDKCLWLFFDDSKNGTRRWCSMQACGNRAKAHRHYLRQKGK